MGEFVSQRFFISEPIAGHRVSLGGDEGRHLARVMRAQPGDVVTLFDGSGAEFAARVASVGRSAVELEVIERREVDRESPVAVTLGVALPKGDRQRFLVEKAVELGVARLVPLVTERGVAQPTASALDRLRRGVIEAAKQCGRNRLMEIALPAPAAGYFESAKGDAIRLLAHPAGKPLWEVAGEALRKGEALKGSGVFCGRPGKPIESGLTEKESRPPEACVFLAVGPEGGFTEEEVSRAAAAGWRTVSLGPRILRVETAGIALAAWWGVATR
jgi:16S rRNA (uracil1498-N3)-methyltransferase